MTSVIDQPILNLDDVSEGDRVHVVKRSAGTPAAWNCGVWKVRRVYRHIRAMVVSREGKTVFVREGDPTFHVWAQSSVEKALW